MKLRSEKLPKNH